MRKNFVGRVDKAAPDVHIDITCVRILTESDIILLHDRLSNAIVSKSLSESCACNLRPETWRRWLSAWLSKRGTKKWSHRSNFIPSPAKNGNVQPTGACHHGKQWTIYIAGATRSSLRHLVYYSKSSASTTYSKTVRGLRCEHNSNRRVFPNSSIVKRSSLNEGSDAKRR